MLTIASTLGGRGLKNAALALIAMAMPGLASATLGEPETSVQADTAQLRGSIKVAERSGYRLHEIQLPTGTRVREFVGANGTVFAVAWSGPAAPNLRQTLGGYFDNYVAAARSKRVDHHHVQIQDAGLVVQASGHMRAFSGRAYLPGAVPSTVSVEELR